MAPKPKHSAARPRRAGENFARTHHLDDADAPDGAASAAKKVKFDVRNPSALAPEEREEEDAFLEADVIGRSAATKRGAVNIDGFDSDSDNETFNARAQERKTSKKGDVNLNEQFDHYGEKDDGKGKLRVDDGGDDDDDMNMFAVDENDDEKKRVDGEDPEFYKSGKKKKEVRFLENKEIQGQDLHSKGGGHINMDYESTSDGSDDDEDEGGADQAEIDEEVGLGGLKKNAPKLEAFNLKEELEEGRFDENQNYVRNAGDADAVHDRWLQGINKKQMKKAAAAHQQREEEAERLRMEEDRFLTSDLLSRLIIHLERAETPLEALARLGKRQKKEKKVPAWKLKKMNKGGDDMEVDDKKQEDDPEQARIKAAIADITDAADKLLSRDHAEIYDQERELLIREYKKDTGQDWVEPKAKVTEPGSDLVLSTKWEFRWVDGRDSGALQGPFDGSTMKAWQDAGYFGEGVEFRPAGEEGGWTRTANFE